MPDTTIIKLAAPALTGLTTAAVAATTLAPLTRQQAIHTLWFLGMIKVLLKTLLKVFLMTYTKTSSTRKKLCHFIS